MESKKGAPCHNTNAVKHGSYLKLAKRRLDGRTVLAKQLNELKQVMISDLGGDITKAQELLVDRVKFKVASLHFMEIAMSKGEMSVNGEYISLANSFRADLALLGLERRERNYIPAVSEYIKNKEKKEKSDE